MVAQRKVTEIPQWPGGNYEPKEYEIGPLEDSPIDPSRLSPWQAETDEFYMAYHDEEFTPSDNFHIFWVSTKKVYTQGQRFQTFHIWNETVANEPESVIISILSDQMRGVLTMLVAQGEIKERE